MKSNLLKLFNTLTTSYNKILSDIDAKKEFELMSCALDLGVGYFITLNIFAKLRYNLGLSNNAKPVTENFGCVNFKY